MCEKPKDVLESWRKAERTIGEALLTLSEEVGKEGCLAERLGVLLVVNEFDKPLSLMSSHADEIVRMHHVDESEEYLV